jgi:hypothetical protein
VELDARFAFVPWFPGLKKFIKGVTQLAHITGAEYSQIMTVKIMFLSFQFY